MNRKVNVSLSPTTKALRGIDLNFPDPTGRKRGQIHRETVEAMRKANGDRRIAAKLLGTDLGNLASRLHRIRQLRQALEDQIK